MENFESPFCTLCQSVLPPIGVSKQVSCYSCKSVIDGKRVRSIVSEYTINFNSPHNVNIAKRKTDNAESADGPISERNCPKCDNNQMSYAAVQLRSADEGQTVFYTCTKCKYTESENS